MVAFVTLLAGLMFVTSSTNGQLISKLENTMLINQQSRLIIQQQKLEKLEKELNDELAKVR